MLDAATIDRLAARLDRRRLAERTRQRVEHLAEAGQIGFRILHERCVDPQHVRRADVDTQMLDLQSQRVREVLDAGLGGVVRGQARSGGERRQRGHGQEVTVGLDESRQHGPGGVEDSGDVDVDDPFEGRRIRVQHRPVAGDAGVGDGCVDAAVTSDSGGHRRLHRGEVADVGDHTEGVGVPESFDGLVQRFDVEVGEDHLRAFGDQVLSRRGTDAARAAGDEYDQVRHGVSFVGVSPDATRWCR